MTQDKFNAIWFDKYREMLQGKIVIYESLIQVCQAVEEVGEEISSSDLYSASASWLGTRGDDDDKKGLHPKILQNKEWLIRLCQELIDLANHEVDELSKLLGQTVVQEITGRNKIREIISNYRSKRRKNESQLTNILGNFIEIAKQEYGILQQEVQGAADDFIKYFAAIVKSLREETINKGSLFIQFYKVIVELHKYHQDLEELSIKDFEELLSHLSNKTTDAQLAKCFVQNFHLNEDLINTLSSWASKTNITDEASSERGYNSLEKEDQKKLDKFMQSELEMLFRECKFSKGDMGVSGSILKGNSSKNQFEEIQKAIKKLVKAPEDMKKPLEELSDVLEKLISHINERLGDKNCNFRSYGTIDAQALYVNYNGNNLSVRDFIANVKNDNNKNYAISDLKEVIKNLNAIVRTHNNNIIDDFMQLQVDNNGVLSRNTNGQGNSSGGRGNTGGDWYSQGDDSLSRQTIMTDISNLISQDLSNHFDQNTGNLEQTSHQTFPNDISVIRETLANIFATLNNSNNANWTNSINVAHYNNIFESHDRNLSNLGITSNLQNVSGVMSNLQGDLTTLQSDIN